jgi:hypothetical protein
LGCDSYKTPAKVRAHVLKAQLAIDRSPARRLVIGHLSRSSRIAQVRALAILLTVIKYRGVGIPLVDHNYLILLVPVAGVEPATY